MKINLVPTALICFVCILLASCEKKVDLKIKAQTTQYPVIFGLLTNDQTNNIVRVSLTENYSDQNTPKEIAAKLEVETDFWRESFVKTGLNTYSLNQPIVPFTNYRFKCTYDTKEYIYETFSGDMIYIDSVETNLQINGKHTIKVNFRSQFLMAVLIQLYIGKEIVNGSTNDTLWEKYNNKFPAADSKIEFLKPFSFLIPNDSTGLYSVQIVKDVNLDKNDILKVEVYSIDMSSAAYLNRLAAPDNYTYDPLSIAPPQNYFVFSNQALGVIIPALKSSKIQKH